MKYLPLCCALLLTSTVWIACKDNLAEPEKKVEVTFAGHVLDENNQPIVGARVQTGGQSATTDANGVFRLPSIGLPENDARLSIRKEGYFHFSRAYIIKDGATQSVNIQLIKKEQVGSFTAGQGGTVQVPGGPTLQFPANSVAAVDGHAYDGTVFVYAHYLDPAAPDLTLYMPGDLRGINLGGEEQSLATFGMIAVELVGAAGEALQVAAGSEIEMTMPIAASQSAAAPASIPLWYYDLDKARWIEEGSAQKIGNQYVGKVKHFSYWNCDFPYPVVVLHGKIFLDNDQHPIANALVRIGPTDQSGANAGYGSTDANGNYAGGVPAGIPLTIRIYQNGSNFCGSNPVYNQDIGTFSAETTLQPIIILSNNQLEAVTFSGRLQNCNGQAVTQGYVKVEDNSGTLLVFPDEQGFINASLLHCASNSLSGVYTGYDTYNILESQPQIFSAPPSVVDLGDVVACQKAANYIRYEMDGQSHELPTPTWCGIDSSRAFMFINKPPEPSFFLMFRNQGALGTFPLSSFALGFDSTANAATILTNLTFFGTKPGEPIIGTFEGTYQPSDGSKHVISGNYHVPRLQ